MAGDQACQNLPKGRYAMDDDTTITPLHQPGSVDDPLTETAPTGDPTGGDVLEGSYARKWVMGPAKAAYRGG